MNTTNTAEQDLAEIIGERNASEAISALFAIASRLRGEHPNVAMTLVFLPGENPVWGKAITRTRVTDEPPASCNNFAGYKKMP